jgi:hypothetical protein
LTLHPGKTRLIEFGRHAAKDRRARGLGKPETFNFLGFTHITGHSRRGGFQLKPKSRSDRVRARLQVVKETLRRRMHETIDEQGAWLRRVMMGFNAYHAVPTNAVALADFRHNLADLWRRTLRRRGQKGAVTWERMRGLFCTSYAPSVPPRTVVISQGLAVSPTVTGANDPVGVQVTVKNVGYHASHPLALVIGSDSGTPVQEAALTSIGEGTARALTGNLSLVGQGNHKIGVVASLGIVEGMAITKFLPVQDANETASGMVTIVGERLIDADLETVCQIPNVVGGLARFSVRTDDMGTGLSFFWKATGCVHHERDERARDRSAAAGASGGQHHARREGQAAGRRGVVGHLHLLDDYPDCGRPGALDLRAQPGPNQGTVPDQARRPRAGWRAHPQPRRHRDTGRRRATTRPRERRRRVGGRPDHPGAASPGCGGFERHGRHRTSDDRGRRGTRPGEVVATARPDGVRPGLTHHATMVITGHQIVDDAVQRGPRRLTKAVTADDERRTSIELLILARTNERPIFVA